MPGARATNIASNVQIPHGVSLFFQRTGATTWLDLGDLGDDVSLTPLVEFLEHRSNRKGVNAVVKRLLTERGLTIEATLNEVNPDNIRLAFYGGAAESGSINVLETAVPTVTASDTLVLPETPADVIAVRSSDGETTYAVTTDYTVSGDTITIVGAGALDTDTSEGDTVHVTYEVAMPGASTTVIELLDETTVEGVARFQIRNNQGGLAQVIELDSVQLAPNGAITVPADTIQSFPLIVTAQEINSQFGRVYTRDIS